MLFDFMVSHNLLEGSVPACLNFSSIKGQLSGCPTIMDERSEGMTDLFIISSSDVAHNIESRFVAANLTANVSCETFLVAMWSVCRKASIKSFAQTLPVSSASSVQWKDSAPCAFLVRSSECCPSSVQTDTKSMGQDFC